MAEPHDRVVHIGKVVFCQICEIYAEPPAIATYDAAVPGCAWAYVCQRHFDEFECQLGIGKGVRITK